MSNSNTLHSKKLRAASAAAANKKMVEEGGFIITVRIRKEQGADVLRALTEELGSKNEAIRFLINFYETHKNV